MSATIKDVAAAAGVSVGTVSKIINKSGYVSDKIRERVLLAISLFNYQPNAVARSLKQSKTNMLGVIVDNIADPYNAELMKSIEDAARTRAYSLILCSHGNDPGQEADAFQRLQEKRVDGIIVMPSNGDAEEPVLPASIPVVAVERRLKTGRTWSVVHENAEASAALVRHLHARGHRRMLFVHGPSRNSAERERLAGIERAALELGLGPGQAEFLEAGADAETAAARVRSRLESQGLPDAVCATGRATLAGAIRALGAMNVRVPGDVAVAGFGDIDPYGIMRPAITIVRENPREIGRIAAEMLFGRIEGGMRYSQPKEITVTPRLVVGDSCEARRHF